jgi:hypothetical protein
MSYSIVNDKWPIFVRVVHLRRVLAYQRFLSCNLCDEVCYKTVPVRGIEPHLLTFLFRLSVKGLSVLSGKRRLYPGRCSIQLDTWLLRGVWKNQYHLC